MEKPLIIYHSPCPDGFGAAYAAWRKFGAAADYLAADHNNYPEPDVVGRDVFILDFSFPREQMVTMQAAARSMIVLDHHKTAIERVVGLPNVTLDLHKSGARLAWEYFHPAEPVPYLIRAVEDRDLFVWQLEGSADFLSYLDTVEFDFEAWDSLARLPEDDMGVFRSKGASMRIKVASMADEIAAGAEPVLLHGIAGHKVNLAGTFANDVGSLLYGKNGTFALMWRIEAGQLRVSLRAARGGPVDVSKMAQEYGGGGHPGAAAFRLELNSPEGRDFLERYIVGGGD